MKERMSKSRLKVILILFFSISVVSFSVNMLLKAKQLLESFILAPSGVTGTGLQCSTRNRPELLDLALRQRAGHRAPPIVLIVHCKRVFREKGIPTMPHPLYSYRSHHGIVEEVKVVLNALTSKRLPRVL